MKPWGIEVRDSARVKPWLEWENAFRIVCKNKVRFEESLREIENHEANLTWVT